MDDLFREIETLVDQGFEGLLDFVRVMEGREAEEPEFRVSTRESVERTRPTTETERSPESFSEENDVILTQTNVVREPLPTIAGVGGLSEVVRDLRELVELPLKRPDLLAALGLEPTTGVLLTGPPGTGKTLTARALAADLDVNYIALVGPEVIGKYYGEAEARLRSIFQKAARSAPCIIFIDEIDSLAPDRSKAEGEVEKRVVAQLLS
ncbi:MAG: AAA family ATPase, partial [Leptolyngbya sp. ERB_1_2]